MSGFDENSKETTKKPVTQLKEITGENGITKAYKKDNMYFIPKGTTLYRGDSNFENKDDSCLLKDEKCEKDASFKFFTPDENYAYKYGLLFEFKTTTDLNLVAMDDISKDFFINAPEEIQDILEDNYGYSSHKRNSVEEKDYKVSQYICDNTDYQGYAANTMKNVARLEDDLNAEVIICNPENHLISIRRIIRDEDQSKLDELRMRRTESDRVRPQKKPRIDIEDRPKPINMGALGDEGDDDEDEEDNFKPKSLFGGKTKKSKKSKKKPSKKKKTKTQKKRKSRKSKTNKK